MLSVKLNFTAKLNTTEKEERPSPHLVSMVRLFTQVALSCHQAANKQFAAAIVSRIEYFLCKLVQSMIRSGTPTFSKRKLSDQLKENIVWKFYL